MSAQPARERSDGDYPDLARIGALVRRWWLALLAAGLLAAALASAAGPRAQPTYVAQSRLLVGPLDGVANVLRAAGQQAQTLSQLATSRPVLDAARRQLGPRAPRDLAEAVRADATGTTRVLVISARVETPQGAARVANAVAAALQQFMHAPRGQAIRQLSAGGVGAGLRVMDPAEPPAHAERTGRSVVIAAAGLTGVLAALALILVGDYFRGRIADEVELREVSGLVQLGAVRCAPARPGPLAMDRPASDAALPFRLLAGRVVLTAPGRRRRMLVVSGAQPDDGGGRVAAELAAALAESGVRVVLVDADPDAGEVSRLFGLEERDGLAALLDEPVHASSQRRIGELAPERRPNLRVLPRGRLRRHDVISSDRAHGTLSRLARLGEVIVVSAGPADGFAAALGWARVADGTILVARRRHTRRDAVTGALGALEQVGATVIGTVLADRSRERPALPRRRARVRVQLPQRLRPSRAPDPERAGGLVR